MYNASIRILSYDKVENILLSIKKTWKIKDGRTFRILFDRFVKQFKPDIKCLKGRDFGFLEFDDPQRFKQVVSDLMDQERTK